MSALRGGSVWTWNFARSDMAVVSSVLRVGIPQKDFASLGGCGNGRRGLYSDGREMKLELAMRAASGGREVYQPFRPPLNPSSSPELGGLTVDEKLEILRERRGSWHEYAEIIPDLTRAGFTPSLIDEITGMTGVEQNQIVVAAQVRSSLKASGMGKDDLGFFDLGGAELLYELRILSLQQRRDSAKFIMDRRMEPKSARELARSVKDFERRKQIEGWGSFTSNPGDALAFALYRKSKETGDEVEIEDALSSALDYAVSDKARQKVLEALGKVETIEASVEVVETTATLQVVRLSADEPSPTPIVVPLLDFSVQGMRDSPTSESEYGPYNPFKVYRSSSAWKSWVAVPGWAALSTAKWPVAFLLPNASLLPGVSGNLKKGREPILLVVDKGDATIEEETFSLVEKDSVLSLRSGSTGAFDEGFRVLGKVLIALRPPSTAHQNDDMVDWL